MLKIGTVMFSEGVNMLGLDDNGSNSAQESGPEKECYDSSDDCSASKPSISKKMAQHVGIRVCLAPDKALEQGHMIDRKMSTQRTQSLYDLNHHPIFVVFSNRVLYKVSHSFCIHTVRFLQLPRRGLSPVGRHCCGKARQKGVNVCFQF